MTGLRKRLTAGMLTAAICITSAGAAFASGAKEEKGFWASAGDWFSDRGSDISNAASTAVSVTGQWFVDRGADISNAATIAVDATGKWFVDRGEDICEVSAIVGTWAGERANDVVILVTDAGEGIACAASKFDPSRLATKEYYLESGEKLLLGDYSDKNPTALSMLANLAASVFNFDLGLDARDLVYDVQNYGTGEVKLSGIALDAVAVLPVIGVLKHLKYVDTIADSAKMVADVTDTASDIAKSVDTAIDVVDTVHDAAKAADVVDTVTDTVKAADTLDTVVDTAKAADTIDDVTDTAKTVDNVADAAKTTDNMADAAKTTDTMADTAKSADLVDDVVDVGKEIGRVPFDELPEKVQETYKVYEDCAWDGTEALNHMADGTDAGRTFKNLDGDLPVVDKAGNKLSYIEYDAYQLGDDPNSLKEGWRGTSRFVRDNLGNTYYTDDHYETYKLIVKAIAG